MNLETFQTKINTLKSLKLNEYLDEFQQSIIEDSLKGNSLNIVAESIKDYFETGNESLVNEISDNYSFEIQAQDFQHSGLCSCCSCGGNQTDARDNAIQNGSRFETVAFFNAPGNKWSQPGGKGNPTNITYSFSNLLDGGLNGISVSDAKSAIQEAFSLWSEVAPLNFTEVTDSRSGSDIRLGQDYIDGRGSTLAFAYFPGQGDISGDVTFDNGERWNNSLFLETAVHEIGHSLGLDHENGTSAIMNPSIQNRFNGLGSGFLLQDDIDGIRSLYGNGNGSVNPIGGNPTPNPDPNPTPSGPRRINGTGGNDVLVGNDRNNRIRGFAGDDYIEGGKGNDDIRGGKGADVFAFKSLDGSNDLIKDYSIAEGDTIEVSRSGFGSSNEFTYDENTGNLSFNNEQIAFLENKPSFSDVAAGFSVV